MVIFKVFLIVLLAVLQVSSSQKPLDQGCNINKVTEVASVIASCTTITVGSFNVPANYQPLIMNLKRGTKMMFNGEISFEKKAAKGYLMHIIGNGVNVEGSKSHQLHGHGEQYWDGKGAAGTPKPVFLYIKGQDSNYVGLRLKNCPKRCVAVDESKNVVLTNFVIDNQDGAPGKAPKGKEGHNTDGFDVAKSQYVTIQHSTVYNQDDCVAINSGAHMIIDNINCYGSHGFDIATGLVKTDQSENTVKNITFKNSNLYNGMIGLHILTCTDGGKGSVQDITYSNIHLNGASEFGIMIQQDFSNSQQKSTGHPDGNVPISNVKFSGITGTMNGGGQYSYALTIRCAAGACSDIKFNDVKISNAKSANECMNYKISGWC